MNQAAILTNIIRNRRSIFPASYIDKEIPKEVIEIILTNANYAPTHKLTQPWRFKVFRKNGLTKLADATAEQYKANTAPELFLQNKYDAMRNKILSSSCVIAINIKLHKDKLPEWEELAAVACAVENMWLTASALNVGAYWSTPGVIKSLHEFLNLAEDEKCIGLFYMGYHNETEMTANRSPIEEKVTWIEE